MDVKIILKKELIFFSDFNKKKDNLEALIGLIEKENLVENGDALRTSIFSREELMSTGIGLGIAVPHVRIQGVKNIIIAIGINKNGIQDYSDILDCSVFFPYTLYSLFISQSINRILKGHFNSLINNSQ